MTRFDCVRMIQGRTANVRVRLAECARMSESSTSTDAGLTPAGEINSAFRLQPHRHKRKRFVTRDGQRCTWMADRVSAPKSAHRSVNEFSHPESIRSQLRIRTAIPQLLISHYIFRMVRKTKERSNEARSCMPSHRNLIWMLDAPLSAPLCVFVSLLFSDPRFLLCSFRDRTVLSLKIPNTVRFGNLW
jgi:hypothetical protein